MKNDDFARSQLCQGSKKPRMDFLRQYQELRPLKGAQINDLQRKLLICEESENDTFHFPRSKKPRMDFLRQYQDWEDD